MLWIASKAKANPLYVGNQLSNHYTKTKESRVLIKSYIMISLYYDIFMV